MSIEDKQYCINCYWHSDLYGKNKCSNLNARNSLFNMVPLRGIDASVSCKQVRDTQLPTNSTYLDCKWFKEKQPHIQVTDGIIDDSGNFNP